MEAVTADLLPRFKARAVWIGVRRTGRGALEYTQGLDFRGHVFDQPTLFDSLHHRCMERGLAVWIPSLNDESTNSLISVPLVSPGGRLGMLYLDSKRDSAPLVDKDFDHVISLSTVVGHQLDIVIRGQVRWRQELTTAQNSVVQAIQAQLDPQSVPEWPQLQVAAHSRSGREVVGDIYDVMQVRNGAAAFLVGHVSAPPVPTATAMIEARTAFRIAVLHADMPHVMLQEMNWLLCTRGADVRMQCAIVLVDPSTGAMLHSLAGPSTAVVVGQSGCPRRLESGESANLGTTLDSTYLTRKGLLGSNELLAVYTPGVATIQDADGRALGEEAFLDSLCDGFGMPARKALEETFSDLTSYSVNGYQPDDITILLAHRL
jgi:serine phosphatase RsbU (regulator of sigma subunit)